MSQVDAFAHNFFEVGQIANIQPEFVPVAHFTDLQISPEGVISIWSPAFPRSSTKVTNNLVALTLQGGYLRLLIKEIDVDISAVCGGVLSSVIESPS